jgi:hypothetical protein
MIWLHPTLLLGKIGKTYLPHREKKNYEGREGVAVFPEWRGGLEPKKRQYSKRAWPSSSMFLFMLKS